MILAYFQWPVIEHEIIRIWVFSVVIIVAGRLVLAIRFHQVSLTSSKLEKWGNYFLAGVFLSGITWGCASYFLFPAGDVAHQALLAVILAGMSAGAVSVLSARWNAVILFLVPSLLPLAISFLNVGNTRFTVLGFVVVIFLFIMLFSAKLNHENILATIVARVEKQTRYTLEKSREIFEDMVRNVPGVVYQFRLDRKGAGSFTYMAPSVYDMLGIKASDAMKDPDSIFNVLYHDDRDALEKDIANSIHTMQRWNYEGHSANKITGEIVWFRGTSHPGKDEDGSTIWNGILFNVTSEKRTENDLRSILDQMLDTFYRTDLEGKLVMVSPSVKSLLGYTPDELYGFRLANLYVEPNGREKFLQNINQGNGVITDYEAPLRHKDGSVVWVSTNAHYYKDEDGNVAGIEGVTRDITAKRDIFLELEKHRQHLETLVTARAKELKSSEARYNHLLKSSPAIIYSCDVTGNHFTPTYCSENIREIFDLDPEKFIATENFWVNNIHPDDRDRVLEGLKELFDKDIYTHEYRFRAGNGDYRWVHDEIRLIRDSEGQAQEIIGCWLDNTDHRKIEDNLRRSEKRFRTLVDNITDGIFVHNLDGKFMDVNIMACNNTGYSRDELLRMMVSDIEIGADAARLKVIWPDLQKGKVLSIDGIHKRKDGTEFPVEVNISQYEMNGEPCVLALARDVTRRRAAENRLKEIINELESFAYSVSHDLRAPLRSINGFCNILLDEYVGDMDETAQMYMKRVVGATNKMSDLIDDLLLLSRLSRKEIECEKLDLSKMVDASIQELIAAEPGREAKITIQPDLFVYADKGLMKVVIANLMSNAWKFTSRKEKTIIDFSMQTRDGKRIYRICDNGAGFNMEYISKLFLPFQRLHPENQFEGNGIGLATVQRIIHRHGGNVWAESEEQKGACFYFTLQ